MERRRRGDLRTGSITPPGDRIAVIAAPGDIRGRSSKWQRYARHTADLDHHRRRPIHWAADTHGGVPSGPVRKPGRPQRSQIPQLVTPVVYSFAFTTHSPCPVL